ncbi:MAG: tetratricopeptide repeat protein [Rhodospirillaceae bacterium]|nr:tetratricopeptide repeat protein [Rhodospirillaceae bacterium]
MAADTPTAHALVREGVAQLNRGQVSEAETTLRQALALDDRMADGWHNLGVALARAGRPAEAVAAMRRAVDLAPGHAVFHAGFGRLLKLTGDLPGAVASFTRALELAPNDAALSEGLALTLMALGRDAEAIPHLRRATMAQPDNAALKTNLGVALKNAGHLDDAETALAAAIALKPDLAEAHLNLGGVRQARGDVDGAIAAYARARVLGAPADIAAFNLATAYERAYDFAAALSHLDQAIVLRPDYAEAHRNRGMLKLMRGDWQDGWTDYDWRWRCADFAARQRPFSGPRWDGRPLKGPLLVWGEQGVGDELLFLGMAPELVARGVDVIWEMDARLVPLVARSMPGMRAVARRDPPDVATGDTAIAAHIPAGSLGQYLRSAQSSFPSRAGYITADAARAAGFRARLGGGSGLRVAGVSWISTAAELGADKSLTLEALLPVLRTPGWRWVDLQYGDTAVERAAFQRAHGIEIIHLDELDLRADLDGVAALMTACDTVLTVSNTTAHLAGALGAPGVVLAAAGARKLWCWGDACDSVPWYPALTMIRQPTPGDWAGAIAATRRRLSN